MIGLECRKTAEGKTIKSLVGYGKNCDFFTPNGWGAPGAF